jgi:hypothetical protein
MKSFVEVIEPTPRFKNVTEYNIIGKKRVAAYARVSTD